MTKAAVVDSGKISTLRSRLSFSRIVNAKLMPIVTGQHSNDMVANFQRLCGLQADGKVTNYFLNAYFRLASTAGEEIFSLMPVIFWVSFPLAVPFLTNFIVLQISGQLAKDFFKLPRPVSPPGCKNPIIKLDTHFETEYGLPSTHTIAGLLPMTILLILLRHGVEVSTTSWISSGVYFVSVALSRLYLGVHSVYDVIAGALLGILVMIVLHVYGDALDVVLYQYTGAVYVQLALLVAYILGYPRSGGWTASFGTAAQMMGPFTGCGLSIWYLCNVNLTLRDQLLAASMVHPRPHLLTHIPSLSSSSSCCASGGANSGGGAVGSAVGGLLHTISTAADGEISAITGARGAVGSGVTVSTASELIHQLLPTHIGSHLLQPGHYPSWQNNDPSSFNQLSTKVIITRMFASMILVGIAKVAFKIIPSLVLNALYDAKWIKPAKIHELDCFGRPVPGFKSYVVEVPVRLVNYIVMAFVTVLLSPYCWQHLPEF